jgi:hypothetical protein
VTLDLAHLRALARAATTSQLLPDLGEAVPQLIDEVERLRSRVAELEIAAGDSAKEAEAWRERCHHMMVRYDR